MKLPVRSQLGQHRLKAQQGWWDLLPGRLLSVLGKLVISQCRLGVLTTWLTAPPRMREGGKDQVEAILVMTQL